MVKYVCSILYAFNFTFFAHIYDDREHHYSCSNVFVVLLCMIFMAMRLVMSVLKPRIKLEFPYSLMMFRVKELPLDAQKPIFTFPNNI